MGDYTHLEVHDFNGFALPNASNLPFQILIFFNFVKVVPIIIGALGTFQKGLEEWLGMIGMANLSEMLQRACLLGSARILRNVLDT